MLNTTICDTDFVSRGRTCKQKSIVQEGLKLKNHKQSQGSPL